MTSVGSMASKYMSDRINGAIAEARVVAERAHKEAVSETLQEIEQDYRGMYIDSVAKWYGAYAPRKYHRNYSLYDLLDLETKTGSMAFEYEISEDRMTTGTNGFSLWDMVFVNGYHGGPRPGHIPTRSTPIQDMFILGNAELENKYKQLIKERTYQRFCEMYGK